MNWSLVCNCFKCLLDFVHLCIKSLLDFVHLCIDFSLCSFLLLHHLVNLEVNILVLVWDLFVRRSDRLLDENLDSLNKADPIFGFFMVVFVFDGDDELVFLHQLDAIKPLFCSKERWKIVNHHQCFFVEVSNVLVFLDVLAVHHVLIRLRDDSNQEVKQDNYNEKLIDEPNQHDQVEYWIWLEL